MEYHPQVVLRVCDDFAVHPRSISSLFTLLITIDPGVLERRFSLCKMHLKGMEGRINSGTVSVYFAALHTCPVTIPIFRVEFGGALSATTRMAGKR
jgi:hypothetical protein